MNWGKSEIHALLERNDAAVVRALLAIYERQTADERAGHYTRHDNKIGFSKFDAEFCTDLAQRVQRGWQLSPKQLAVVRNKVKRYWRQLAEIANARQAPPVAMPAAQPEVLAVEACTCENYDGEDICPVCKDRLSRPAYSRGGAVGGSW